MLALHKAKQQAAMDEDSYAAQIQGYKARMAELEEQQKTLQAAAGRFSEVRLWLDTFEDHIKSGAIMDTDDSMVMKELVEQIIVGSDGMVIQFKCGVSIEQEYMK